VFQEIGASLLLHWPVVLTMRILPVDLVMQALISSAAADPQIPNTKIDRAAARNRAQCLVEHVADI